MAHIGFDMLQVVDKQEYVWMVTRVQMSYVTSGVDVASVGLTRFISLIILTISLQSLNQKFSYVFD